MVKKRFHNPLLTLNNKNLPSLQGIKTRVPCTWCTLKVTTIFLKHLPLNHALLFASDIIRFIYLATLF